MTTYTYTGRLTDLGEAPFPDARPRLRVFPEQDTFTPSGIGASRGIPVATGYDGAFVFDLIASADLNPPTLYTLRCNWYTTGAGGTEVLAGWSDWTFTALIGGGPIATMPNAPLTRVWFDTNPPPVNRPGIIWLHPVTGDIREWID